MSHFVVQESQKFGGMGLSPECNQLGLSVASAQAEGGMLHVLKLLDDC